MGSELEQEVDGIETSVGTSDDEASSSGSLWARIKYALANMVATSGAQTIADVKTFTSSPVVPTTPDSIYSAVNQAYVESTVDGVNNIVHKSGNEVITGQKNFNGLASPGIRTSRVTGTNIMELFKIPFVDNESISINAIISSRQNTGFVRFAITSVSGELTDLSVGSSLMLSEQISNTGSIYAYKKGNNIVVAIGNSTSGNYCYSLMCLSAYHGAAYIDNIDNSEYGKSVTDEVVTYNALSVYVV